MEVPGDPPSQGRDSVNVSGHAIPAVLCGNQYAVLYDTEPTELEDLDGWQFSHNIQFTRIVDFCVYGFSILITSCGGQGIDHPDSIPVKRKFSLSD